MSLLHAVSRYLSRSRAAALSSELHRAPLVATILVEQHREQQNPAAYQILVKRRHVQQAHRILDRAHDQHADQHAGDRRDAARQRYAAEHARGDHAEFEPDRRLRVAEAHPRREHHAREARHEPLQHEHGDLDAHHRQPREQRGLAVAADGQHVLAEHRLAQQEAEHDEADDVAPDRIRDAEKRPAAEIEEALLGDHHRVAVRRDERESAHDFHHRERDDQRVDPPARDQHAVDEPDRTAREHAARDAEHDAVRRGDQRRRDDARERDDRRDRQVDLAEREHEHHRHRDRADQRDRQQQALDVARREEVRHGQRQRREQHEKHHHDAGAVDQLPHAAARSRGYGGGIGGRGRALGLHCLAHVVCIPVDRCGALARQREFDQRVGRRLRLRDLARDPSFLHHDDPVRHADHLGQVARHENHRAARFREFVEQVVDFRARADVDAARRLVHQEHVDAFGQPAREHDLLLVAAGQRADRRVAVAGLDREPLDVALRKLAFAPRVEQHARRAEMPACADVQVVGHRRDRDDALLLAVFRAQREAGAHRVARAPERHPLPVQLDVPRARARGAVQQLHQLRAARADQPEEADDLAAPRGERHGLGQPGPRQPFRLDQHVAGRARPVAVHILDRTADHAADQPVAIEIGHGIERVDAAAVAEHRHPVAQFINLFHPVRDVDDRAALRTQRPDDPEQLRGLARGQRTRRFVERDHARIAHQRLADLDHLALADRQILHRDARIDVLAEPLQRIERTRRERALVDHAEPARQLPEHQVFGDRQLGHQMQLLVDDRDAGLERRARRREALRGAVQRQRAGLRLVHARQHLQQRRLPRAVLAHQPVHLARAHRQRHGIERAHARERHRDPVEREQRAAGLPRASIDIGTGVAVVAGYGRHRLRGHRVLASCAQMPSSVRTACQFARVISLPLVCVSGAGVLPLRIQSTRFCVLSLPWFVELTAIVP
ncbi:hypothetical protein Bcep18194_B0045 [Burkholderia lata]|uniref:Uncharacterized protein n=1 Tax=Burkholderia lata (strain ATCC 17760 / DSM 23089 / LMG 22485 / NCIMB 9086 / R18194 / 383) TaxID=482957 RepID=Q39BJ9_BURL3|nr:hypothetical protein Bcep18194_B0045 [Burkholderia lata]